MKRKYRVQGAWLFVAVFLGANIYVWLKIPSEYFWSITYWASYVVWAIIGGWGLLPKKIGVDAQKSRLNPLVVAVPALVLLIASKWIPAIGPLFLSFFGIFGGMAIRMGYYLVQILVSDNPLSKGSQTKISTGATRGSTD